MSINFIKEGDKLVLKYSPEYGHAEIRQKLDDGEVFGLRRCFSFYKNNEYEDIMNEYDEDSFLFVIGILENDYYKLDKNIHGLENAFYFHKDIYFDKNYFFTSRNISILRRIDKLVNEDVHVSLDEESDGNGHIPFIEFKKLITSFPNSYELTKYSEARISVILRNYLDGLGDKEMEYEKLLNKRSKRLPSSEMPKLAVVQTELFETAYKTMKSMLDDATGFDEKTWQEKICKIICLIYLYLSTEKGSTHPFEKGSTFY